MLFRLMPKADEPRAQKADKPQARAPGSAPKAHPPMAEILGGGSKNDKINL